MPQNFINSLNQKLEKSSKPKNYNTWLVSLANWDNAKKQRFVDVLNKLANHPYYLGQDPKIIGEYNSVSYPGKPLLVFGKLSKKGSNRFESNTNNLLFKLDGTEYAMRDKSNLSWQIIKI